MNAVALPSIVAARAAAVLLALMASLGSALGPGTAHAADASTTARAAAGPPGGVASGPPRGCPPLLDHRQPRLQDEAMQDLCQYAGRVVLVVNTASYCGFTPQYRGLEQLYDRYRARGLVVLGFPSNDFSQEPGQNAQIADFCESTFGVRFPMFSKTSVTGPQASTLFAQLARASGTAPRWNFHKYLIGRDGRLVAHWPSDVAPEDAAVVAQIEKSLGR